MTAEKKILAELKANGVLLKDIHDRLVVLETNSTVFGETYSGINQRLAKLEERYFHANVHATPVPFEDEEDTQP